MLLEIELKLEVAIADVPRLQEYLVNCYGVGQRQHVVSTYFDSPDQILRSNGFGLRIRQIADKQIQTLKSAGKKIGAISQRQEWEQPIASSVPDLTQLESAELRQQLVALIAQRPLLPLFVTDFMRHTWQVSCAANTIIEIALDQGEIRNNQQMVIISELELELKTGEIEQLNMLAEQLCKVVPMKVATKSKAGRGYQLNML